MQYVRIVVIGVGVVFLVLMGAVMCLAAVAIAHASEDMRNWEYWNGIDDRMRRQGLAQRICLIPLKTAQIREYGALTKWATLSRNLA